jgi:hypothetical protein
LDNYNDITVKPADACAKAMWVLANEKSPVDDYRSYVEHYVDIAKLMADYVSQMQDANTSAISALTNAMGDI